ncbi:hydroxyacid dehydrogenase [Streptomyces sp. VRA16 Mangrove soil]|uniref:hydroxyacid dehydrogenase n=1 Tax=Streptomyces sp. VRA16 Mangrove soil TaxID=2817434 RepID=UPI001A9E5D66|nr:hydroxyacid dehydrogenase [Streptomyces sp. VRA16 Mangrove soil]
MNAGVVDDVFPPAVRARLEEAADIQPPHVVTEFTSPVARAALAECEVLLTGWGCPRIDVATLDLTPRLRAVIHSAGTVKTFLTPAAYERGITVSSAASANAVPVAEFTLAAIILGAKRAFSLSHLFRTRRTHRTAADLDRHPWLGTRGITVGVVGASRIGRRVLQLLRTLDTEVLLYDPYVGEAEAQLLGATRTDLDTLVATSDVVTLHAPETPETRHLLDARRLGMMRPGALLVNTARGPLVDTEALTEHLVSGRLDAVLDVTQPEPLPHDHPLWELPNVFITPHMAGAQGNEVGRLGALAVDELARYARGVPLNHPVRLEDLERIA